MRQIKRKDINLTRCVDHDLHTAWSTRESLLDQWYSTFVVPLVLNRPDSVNQCKRSSVNLHCSCLQRTTRNVLGAIEFICHTEDVVAVFNRNSVDRHLYADDKFCSVLQAFLVPNNSIHALLIHIYMLISAPKLFYNYNYNYNYNTVTDIDTTRERLVNCILDVRKWCASRRLQLNAQKYRTGVVWEGC